MWHKNGEALRLTPPRRPGEDDEIPIAPGAHRIDGINNSNHSGSVNSSGQNSSRRSREEEQQAQQQQQQQQQRGRTPPPPSSPSTGSRRHEQQQQQQQHEQQQGFNPYPIRYDSYQPPLSESMLTRNHQYGSIHSSATATTTASSSTTTSAAMSAAPVAQGPPSPQQHARLRHRRKDLNELERGHRRTISPTVGDTNTTSSVGDSRSQEEATEKEGSNHDDRFGGTTEFPANAAVTAATAQAAASTTGTTTTNMDSFINRQRNAGINIVEATLVENEDEIAERMRQKEALLLQKLAEKDAQLKAKDAELRRVHATQQQQQQQHHKTVAFNTSSLPNKKGSSTPSTYNNNETSSIASSEMSIDRAEFMRNRILQRDEVKLGRLVSTGTFNSVYNIKSIKLDEQSYRWVPREHIQQRQHIVDIITRKKLVLKCVGFNLDPKKRPLASKRLLYEAKLLITKVNNHPNIIKILGAAAQDVPDMNFFFIIPKSDYTLYDALSGSGGGSKWNKRQKGNPKFLHTTQVKAAIDIAAGLDHLHSLNIMCSDLKPENIGYSMDTNCWKLCNLSKAQSLVRKARGGSSSSMGQQQKKQMMMMKKPYNMDLRTSNLYHGTPPYAAPEISQKIPCNIAVDTFSFAIILWEITSVRLCFGRESKTLSAFTSVIVDEATSGAKWQRPEFDKDAPKALQEIIQQCWEKDPRYRPYMKDVLSKLKFFQETLSAVL